MKISNISLKETAYCGPDSTDLHPERIYQDLHHLFALRPALILFPSFLQQPTGKTASWGESGWLTGSAACHEWIYSGGDVGRRRSNWRVTHNQTPYLAPAKLGCIRWLVIGLDLANVSHSRTSRQLSVIRGWPGLPFAAAPPPLRPPPLSLLLTVPILAVWQGRRKLCWPSRSSPPALLQWYSSCKKPVCLWTTCMKHERL